jgi:hypothetical protein
MACHWHSELSLACVSFSKVVMKGDSSWFATVGWTCRGFGVFQQTRTFVNVRFCLQGGQGAVPACGSLGSPSRQWNLSPEDQAGPPPHDTHGYPMTKELSVHSLIRTYHHCRLEQIQCAWFCALLFRLWSPSILIQHQLNIPTQINQMVFNLRDSI